MNLKNHTGTNFAFLKINGLRSRCHILGMHPWYFGFNWNDVGDIAESIATATQPELPVDVLYRESWLGKGYVAIIKSTSTEPLIIEINLRDSEAKNKKTETKMLSPNQTLTIGWLEGWEFKADDVIKISSPEYRTGVYIIK